jgi:hypothetical protein
MLTPLATCLHIRLVRIHYAAMVQNAPPIGGSAIRPGIPGSKGVRFWRFDTGADLAPIEG